MWTRSARKPEGFKVEVKDWNGVVIHSAWYPTAAEADRAGEYHERLATIAAGAPIPTLDEALQDLSDDELLAELAA